MRSPRPAARIIAFMHEAATLVPRRNLNLNHHVQRIQVKPLKGMRFCAIVTAFAQTNLVPSASRRSITRDLALCLAWRGKPSPKIFASRRTTRN